MQVTNYVHIFQCFLLLCYVMVQSRTAYFLGTMVPIPKGKCMQVNELTKMRDRCLNGFLSRGNVKRLLSFYVQARDLSVCSFSIIVQRSICE